MLDKLKFNLRHLSQQKYPFRSFLAYVLVKARLYALVRYRKNNSVLQMRRAGIARLLWENPDMVLDGELFLAEVIQQGDIFVDVGANIGVMSLLASRIVGALGCVIAIEPHPRTYDALVKNLTLNRTTNVTTKHLAVGPESGFVRFTDRIDDEWNKVDYIAGSIEVKMKTLDEVLSDHVNINVLKIDVEGFELNVLQGATQVLSRTECILLECWGEHTKNFGCKPEDLNALLKRASFQGYCLDEADGKIQLTSLDIHTYSGYLENWVFVRDFSRISHLLS